MRVPLFLEYTYIGIVCMYFHNYFHRNHKFIRLIFRAMPNNHCIVGKFAFE